MNIVEGIKKYFHGEDKVSKIARFESINSDIEVSRNKITELTKSFNDIVTESSDLKKAADMVLSSPSSGVDHVNIALDNVRYSGESVSHHIGLFSDEINKLKWNLSKSEKDMAKLLSDAPEMAGIIINVKHDEAIEKALETVFACYKSGDISKAEVISAYKSAVSSLRTDRNLELILDNNLKDI